MPSSSQYIGFDLLKALDWDLKEKRTILNVHGNPKGQLLSVNLETDYMDGDIMIQFFSQTYTKNYTGEVMTGTRTTEHAEWNESFFMTKNDKPCQMIEMSALESGYLSLDGYLTDNGILYYLNIAYLEKDAERAKELLHQWADLF